MIKMPKYELTVEQLPNEDTIKEKAFVDLEAIGVRAGDCLKIRGGKRTYATASYPYPMDIGKHLIRIGYYTRENASVSVGGKVYVSKVTSQPAESVVVKPEMRLNVDEEFLSFLKKRWIGRFITRGDIVPLPILGDKILFSVEGYYPDNEVVQITENSRVIVRSSGRRSLNTYMQMLCMDLVSDGYRLKVPRDKFAKDLEKFVGRRIK